jgi:hypothetical protein
MAHHFEQDDQLPWGWLCNGTWRALPKEPMLLGGLGPPPFSVELPSGEMRHVLHEPSLPVGD